MVKSTALHPGADAPMNAGETPRGNGRTHARGDTAETARGTHRVMLGVFLFALALRVVFLAWIDDPMLFGKYIYFARKLAGGETIGQRIVDLSPFYLYFTTLFTFFCGGNWELLKGFQAVAGAINALLVFRLGERVFGRPAGVLAALLYAAYGNLIVLETTLEPTVFVLLFNLCCILLLHSAADPAAGVGKTAAAGAMAGLSVITKPSFLLFLPLGALWLLLAGRRERPPKRRAAAAALFVAAAALLVFPVTLRNFVQLGDRVLVTADAGKVFYHGNSRNATALEWAQLPDEGFREESEEEPDHAHVLFRETASRLAGRPLSPSESSRFWVRRTLRDIAADPAGHALRELKKLVFFFTDYEMHFIAPAYKEYRSTRAYPFVRYGLIAALGIAGMALAARRCGDCALLYGAVGLYLLSGLIFLVQSRYRTPAVPYLCVFAGHTLFVLKERLRRRQWRRAATTAAAVALLLAFSYGAFRAEIDRADRWQQATKLHYQTGARRHFAAGRYRRAVEELDRCLEMIPDFSPAHNLRGKALSILGEPEAAMRDFRRVIALTPEMPEGYRNAGYLSLLSGDTAAARRYLEEALRRAPGDRKIIATLKGLEP